MDIYNNKSFNIEDIMKSIPHKFRNAKNMQIVIEALSIHKNKILESLVTLRESSHLSPNDNFGDMLNQCGSNWNVKRESGWDDDMYRIAIQNAINKYVSSGNIVEISNFIKSIDSNPCEMSLGEQFGVHGNGYSDRTANLTVCVYEKNIDKINSIRNIMPKIKSAGIGLKQFSFPNPVQAKTSDKVTNFPYAPNFEFFRELNQKLPNDSYFGIESDLISQYFIFDENAMWTDQYKRSISEVGFSVDFLYGKKYSIIPRGDLSTTMSIECEDKDAVRIVLQSEEDPLNPNLNQEVMVDNFGRTYLIPAPNVMNQNDIFHSESYKDSIQMMSRDNGSRVIFTNISSSFITLESPNKQKWRVYLGVDSRLICVNTSVGDVVKPVISNISNPADRWDINIDNYGRLSISSSKELENKHNELIQSNKKFEILTDRQRLIIKGVD